MSWPEPELMLAIGAQLRRPLRPGHATCAQDLVQVLSAHGDCLVCGGMVRDLLGSADRRQDAHDIDLVSSCDPQTVRQLGAEVFADWQGLPGRPSGVVSSYTSEFIGVVRFGEHTPGRTYPLVDVISMRAYGTYLPRQYVGAVASAVWPLAFGPDLLHDAQARCFTVNALYLDLTSGHVVDPLGYGWADLRAKVLRTCSDKAPLANERWGCRYVHMRRLGFSLLPKTREQVAAHFAHHLAAASPEAWLRRCLGPSAQQATVRLSQMRHQLVSDGMSLLAQQLANLRLDLNA